MVAFFTGFSTINRDHKTNTVYDIELIKRDLLNHFYTRKGARVMMPEYGSIIWDMMFEPLTPSNKELIYEDVKRIVNSDPRVEVENIKVQESEHGIYVFVNMFYTPLNALGTLEVMFDRKYAEGNLLR